MPLPYVAASGITVFVSLFMFSWLAMYVGLATTTFRKSLAVLLGLALLWIIVPLAAQGLIQQSSDFSLPALCVLSPFWAPLLMENPLAFSERFIGATIPILIFNTAFYGAVALLFRHLCIRGADRFLGRA